MTSNPSLLFRLFISLTHRTSTGSPVKVTHVVFTVLSFSPQHVHLLFLRAYFFSLPCDSLDLLCLNAWRLAAIIIGWERLFLPIIRFLNHLRGFSFSPTQIMIALWLWDVINHLFKRINFMFSYIKHGSGDCSHPSANSENVAIMHSNHVIWFPVACFHPELVGEQRGRRLPDPCIFWDFATVSIQQFGAVQRKHFPLQNNQIIAFNFRQMSGQIRPQISAVAPSQHPGSVSQECEC